MDDSTRAPDEPTEDPADTLLDLGRRGSRITLRLGAAYAPDSPDPARRSWRHADIAVEAHPFTGTITTLLTGDDIAEYRELVRAFETEDREHVVIGGHRAAEIVLRRHDETVEVSVTASGDDPWPLLRFLIFPD